MSIFLFPYFHFLTEDFDRILRNSSDVMRYFRLFLLFLFLLAGKCEPIIKETNR